MARRSMHSVTRLLVYFCVAFLASIGSATAQRGTEMSRLLLGELDPEGFDLVSLRFDGDGADFVLLKAQAEANIRQLQETHAFRNLEESGVTIFALNIRLLAWVDLVEKCADRGSCDQRAADVRAQLQAFRALRDRLARGELADGDGWLRRDAPFLERALATDAVAKELLERSVRERMESEEELKAFLGYEQLAIRRSNSEWLQSALTSQGWLHFTDDQLGLPPDAQRAPIATQILGGMVAAVTEEIPHQVDLALWIMFRNIPDADFKREMLTQALPFVQQRQSSSLFFSTMTDRLAVEGGEPQVYGTETRCGLAKVLEYYPIFDEQRVDARRGAIGLPSLKGDTREGRQIGEPCMN